MGRWEIVPIRTRSQLISTVIVLAAVGTVLDSVLTPGFTAGVWFGLIFMISPLTGIILGPYAGFLSVLISILIGHSVMFRETVYEFLFAIGAPIGAAMSGLLFRGRWKPVFLYYTGALAAFLLTPVSWQLPLWGIWDCLLAYLAIVPAAAIIGRWTAEPLDLKRLPIVLALCALIGLEADVLFRIFVFVPCQTYRLFYGFTPEVLRVIWITTAPTITPAKVAVSAFFTSSIGASLAKAMAGRARPMSGGHEA
ncbi:TPA: hypothetical protein EYP44_02695 [Candidatus Bathyarchaeota archaeon]|nr:hypothetical protein [Candidatus Bathyarchaeota archaeon]